MLCQDIDKHGHKTIYEMNMNDFMQSYRGKWAAATPESRAAAKAHWVDIYKNAIFPESFRNAERMLALIAELEDD